MRDRARLWFSMLVEGHVCGEMHCVVHYCRLVGDSFLHRGFDLAHSSIFYVYLIAHIHVHVYVGWQVDACVAY